MSESYVFVALGLLVLANHQGLVKRKFISFLLETIF